MPEEKGGEFWGDRMVEGEGGGRREESVVARGGRRGHKNTTEP